jgi:hypothetical protein
MGVNFTSNSLEVKENGDGQWTWLVRNGDVRLASGDTYPDRRSCLVGVFAVFFGQYDNDTFMALYSEWQESLPKAERWQSAPAASTR